MVARCTNAMAGNSTVLAVIPDAAGDFPADWPANGTAADILQLTGGQINTILGFYGLGLSGALALRSKRILRFLGYRI